MMMVLGRKYTLATTKGHVINFEKDKPVFVPKPVIPDAVAIGAQAVNKAEGDKVQDALPQDPKDVNMDGPQDRTERENQIQTAIRKLVAMNSRKDFTAAGVPSTFALNRILGWDVDALERNVMWQLYCDIKATEEMQQ